jgi:hypothetical protein
VKYRRSAGLLLSGLVALAAACGDDRQQSTPTPPSSARQAEQQPAEAAAAAAPDSPVSADRAERSAAVDTYCTAHLDAERATLGEDEEAIEAAFRRLESTALPEIADTVATVLTEAREFLPTGAMPTPEFDLAYGDLVGWVGLHCGFNQLDVVAKEYALGGIGSELAAGPTVINLTNAGAEMHEMAVLRKNPGVTEPVEELLALPEDEARTKLTFVGASFAAPGQVGHTVVDLVPGEYVAVCFLPTGATPEAMAEMEGGGAELDGPPHFVHGMMQPFVVPVRDATGG